VSLLARVGPLEVYATDIDPAAVRCARANLGARGLVLAGDLFEPVPASLRGRVAVVTANAPYVPSGAIATLPAEARIHEARVALDGGADGLDVQRRIAATASTWLAPGGHLLIETSHHQAARTLEVVSAGGLLASVVTSVDLDATVVVGELPPPQGRV
jgi:release factor glutamine methyltransferase